MEEEMKDNTKFTEVEIRHLLFLIADNEREGMYWGNKEQYWKRIERIKGKLERLLK